MLILTFLALAAFSHASNRLTETKIVDLPLPPSNGPEPLRISGYFDLDRTFGPAKMFYFLFQDRALDPKAPVVLWMTGGPGCSSELAVFYENGPFSILPNYTLTLTEYGWDNAAWLIYVDQPINTGYSFSPDPRDEVHDEKGVSNDMLDFLNELLQAHPELDGRDFFVTGESYAGHYVPAVSARIFKAMKTKEKWVKVNINLKGFAIGNGLTDPAIQYGAYADYAALNGLIDEDTRQLILAAYPACKAAIDVCNGHKWKAECLLALTYCQTTQVQSILSIVGNINIYDIRKPCIGNLCYDFSLMDEYLNLPSTRKALGVGDKEWVSCNMSVYQDMQGYARYAKCTETLFPVNVGSTSTCHHCTRMAKHGARASATCDWMKDYAHVIPPMLEGGVRAAIYAGDQDFICNYVGNSRWVANLTWDGKPDGPEPHPKTWTVDGDAAGLVTDYGPLKFIRVYAAGHMVPMDQPKNALYMLQKFLSDESLSPSLEATGAPEGPLADAWSPAGVDEERVNAAVDALNAYFDESAKASAEETTAGELVVS